MTSHIVPTTATTTTTTTATTAAPPGAWVTLSEALTSLAPDLSGRHDLTVTCAPGAGGDAPARYLPELGVIEIDGDLLPMPPEDADPARPADRARYPTLWGAFTHEAAHAAHSAWLTPTAWAEIAGTAVGEAAMTLEESRAEAAQLRRRPGDRRWLRAMVRDLVLADTAADTT